MGSKVTCSIPQPTSDDSFDAILTTLMHVYRSCPQVWLWLLQWICRTLELRILCSDYEAS